MGNNSTLLRVECPGELTFEIQGPEPPARVEHLAPADTSVIVRSAHQDTPVVVQGDTPGIQAYDVTTQPFLFEETPYQFVFEALHADWPDEEIELVSAGWSRPIQWQRIGKTTVHMGTVNFRSQVGLVRLQFRQQGQIRLDITLEVFPSKIDYKNDFVALRANLEHEVRELAYDVGRLTYRKAARKRHVKAGEVEWLENLRLLFGDLDRAFVRINLAPRSKIYADQSIRRADRATRSGATVRRYVRTHAQHCRPHENGIFSANGERWRISKMPVERKVLSYDTVENRFIKWALSVLLRRIRQSKARLNVGRNYDAPDGREALRELLASTERRIRLNADAGFLAEVEPRGLSAVQSLALHMAPGYREFFTTFLDLLSGLDIHGGPFELSEKDVHVLYEMWCFIKLGRILQQQCKITDPPDWLVVDRNGISVRLSQGHTSELALLSPQGEEVNLRYNPREKAGTGITCKPDNTLEIRKLGSKRGFFYIFDAKYRISDDLAYVSRYGAPGPPVDTINRMHAYRDQIVYEGERDAGLSKADDRIIWDWGARRHIQKNVAALVLYPNVAGTAEANRFYQSINEVGVGGVPFLPSQTEFVSRILSQLVERSSETEEDLAIMPSVTEEHERIRKAYEYGMVYIVSGPKQLEYILANNIYHTPYRKVRGIRLRADFILFYRSPSKFPKQHGIWYAAEVKHFEITPRSGIRPKPPWKGRSDGLYVCYELTDIHKLKDPLVPEKGNTQPYFRITTRLAAEEAAAIEELSLIREPERRLCQELRRADLKVRVREKDVGDKPVYSIADMRLNLMIGEDEEVVVSFDPIEDAFFHLNDELFSAEDLMFQPGKCIRRVKKLVHPPEAVPST